jgi:hypothetical protein
MKEVGFVAPAVPKDGPGPGVFSPTRMRPDPRQPQAAPRDLKEGSTTGVHTRVGALASFLSSCPPPFYNVATMSLSIDRLETL